MFAKTVRGYELLSTLQSGRTWHQNNDGVVRCHCSPLHYYVEVLLLLYLNNSFAELPRYHPIRYLASGVARGHAGHAEHDQKFPQK